MPRGEVLLPSTLTNNLTVQAERLRYLTDICSVMQIAGLMLIGLRGIHQGELWPRAISILIALCGFAGVVKYFLPTVDRTLTMRLATLAGLGIILLVLFEGL